MANNYSLAEQEARHRVARVVKELFSCEYDILGPFPDPLGFRFLVDFGKNRSAGVSGQQLQQLTERLVTDHISFPPRSGGHFRMQIIVE